MKKKIIIFSTIFLLFFGLTACQKEPDYSKIYQNDIYYNLFVRSFADSDGDGIGDLNGVTENLDYLEELGITAIWLLPIFESPSYHGYDTTDYFKIQPEYGTMEDFDNLLLKAKEKNIKIMLDLVLNHTSDQHPWYVSAYNDPSSPYYEYYYLEDKTHQVFGGGLIDLNLGNKEVQKEIYKISDFYLDKGVSGFRLDAVYHFFEELGTVHRDVTNILFINQYKDYLNSKYSNVKLIGEVFVYDSEVLSDYARSGISYFDFYTKQEIENKVAGGGSSYLFSRNMERHYNRLLKENNNYVNPTFIGNHDLDRVASIGAYQDPLRMNLAIRTLLTLPGSPFIYYGDEIGLKGARYEGSEIQGKTVYDEYRRSPFLWGNEYETTWLLDDGSNANTKNLTEQLEDETSLYYVYQEMIKVRKSIPALMYGNKIYSYDEFNNTIGYIVEIDDNNFNQKVLVIHNNSRNILELDFDYKTLYGSKTLEGFQTSIFELPKNYLKGDK